MPAMMRPSASHQRFGATRHQHIVGGQAGSGQQDHRPAAILVRQRADDGRGEELHAAQSATKTPLIQPASGVGAGEFLDQRRQHRNDDAHRHDVEDRDHEDEDDRRLAARNFRRIRCGGHGYRRPSVEAAPYIGALLGGHPAKAIFLTGQCVEWMQDGPRLQNFFRRWNAPCPARSIDLTDIPGNRRLPANRRGAT